MTNSVRLDCTKNFETTRLRPRRSSPRRRSTPHHLDCPSSAPHRCCSRARICATHHRSHRRLGISTQTSRFVRACPLVSFDLFPSKKKKRKRKKKKKNASPRELYPFPTRFDSRSTTISSLASAYARVARPYSSSCGSLKRFHLRPWWTTTTTRCLVSLRVLLLFLSRRIRRRDKDEKAQRRRDETDDDEHTTKKKRRPFRISPRLL